MVYIIYKRPHVWQTPISIRTDVSDGYLYDYQSSKYVIFDGSQVKADPFTRGACAEASAGAITYI